MSEVYDLAMRIGVTGDVLSQLSQISTRLGELAAKVDGLNEGFDKIGVTMGKLGLAMVGTGAAIITGLDKVASYYDDIQIQQLRLIDGGWSQADAARAYAVAMEAAAANHMKISEAFPMMAQLMTQFGNERLAEQVLGPMLQAQLALRRLGDQSALAPLVQMWQREGLTPDQLIERMNTVVNLVERTAGRVTAADYQRVYQMAGAAAPAWSYRFRTQELPELMEMLPPSGRMNLGSILGQDFIKLLQDKKGQISDLLAPGESLQAIENDPYAVAQALVRGMRAHGYGINQQNVSELLAGQLGMNSRELGIYAPMMLQGEEAMGAASPFARTPELRSVAQIDEIRTIADAKAAAAAAVDRMLVAVGEKGLSDVMLGKWQQLIGVMDSVTSWVNRVDPSTITTISTALVDTAEFLTVAGSIGIAVKGLALLLSPAGAFGLAVAGLMAIAIEAARSFDPELFAYQMKVLRAEWNDTINYMLNLLGHATWLTGVAGTDRPTNTAEQMLSARSLLQPLVPFADRFGAALPFSSGSVASIMPSGAFRLGSAASAAVTPGTWEGKPVTVVTNLNVNGRQLASSMQQFMLESMQQSNGAGAANGVSFPHYVDPGFSPN